MYNPALRTLKIMIIVCALNFSVTAAANCSAELFAVSRFGFEKIPGDPLARQLYEARKSQAHAALAACERAKNEKRREEEEQRKREAEYAREQAAKANQALLQASTLAQEEARKNLINSAVAQAIRQKRCDSASEISLKFNRFDLAQQVINLCKPEEISEKMGLSNLEINEIIFESRNIIGKSPAQLLARSDLIVSDDYPILAVHEKRSGRVQIRVSVSANGEPVFCEIISSSGHADLDEATCWIFMTKAKFLPGKNSANKYVHSYYIDSVKWNI